MITKADHKKFTLTSPINTCEDKLIGMPFLASKKDDMQRNDDDHGFDDTVDKEERDAIIP